MSTTYGQRRGEGQAEKAKGVLDLGAFVRRNNEPGQATKAFEKRMEKDPIGTAQAIFDAQLIAENMARQAATDAARGLLTPIVPKPRAMWQNSYRVLEFLYRSFHVMLLVFAGMEIAFTWNQGGTNWRLYLLVLACVQSAWWLFHATALVTGYMNEREAFREFHEYFVDSEMEVLSKSTETVKLTHDTAAALNSLKLNGARPIRDPGSVSLVVNSGFDKYQRNLAQYRDALQSVNEGTDTTIRYRDSQYQQQELSPKLPCMNLPSSRFGFIYESMMTAFVIVPLVYLHLEINANTDAFTTYNLYRTFRVYIWLTFGTMLFNVVVAFLDWYKLIDAAFDFTEAHAEACKQMSLDMVEQFTNFPRLSGVRVIACFLTDFVINPGVLVLAVAHMWMLVRWDPTNFAIINYYEFMVIEFVAWIVFLSAALLSMVGMFYTWNHRCAFRVMWHHTLYWLGLGFWLFTVWWYMRKGFIAGQDALLATNDLFLYEDYIWAALLAYTLHLYNTMFWKLRDWFNWQFQLTFAPFAYGL